MSYLTLSLALIFVLIPLILSRTLNLGLEKDTLIATIRSIIQLLAVGYILQFVFDNENFIYIILMIILMIVAATHNARKKGASIMGNLALNDRDSPHRSSDDMQSRLFIFRDPVRSFLRAGFNITFRFDSVRADWLETK